MADIKKRSPKGELKPYQMKDGRYGIAASLGKNETGKRIRHIETGKTEQEVIDKMRLWLNDNGYVVEDEVIVINGQSTVEQFVQEFKVKALIGSGISDVTLENYLYSLKHFERHFSNQRIGYIDTDDMNRFFSKMVNTMEGGEYKYSQTTLDRAVYITNKMFSRAVKKGYLLNNPMGDSEFKVPKSKKVMQPITALSAEDMGQLKSVLSKNRIVYPVIALISMTGMRTQEALGLRWGDIDFNTPEIYIQNAITKEIKWDSMGNKISAKTVLGNTKNKPSTRKLLVPDNVLDILRDWKQLAPQISKTKTGFDDFVFGNTKNSSWTYGGFRSSVNKCLDRAGMDTLRLHRLRHTVATMLANESDANVFNIMNLLGHNRVRTAQKYIDIKDNEELKRKNRELMRRFSMGEKELATNLAPS